MSTEATPLSIGDVHLNTKKKNACSSLFSILLKRTSRTVDSTKHDALFRVGKWIEHNHYVQIMLLVLIFLDIFCVYGEILLMLVTNPNMQGAHTPQIDTGASQNGTARFLTAAAADEGAELTTCNVDLIHTMEHVFHVTSMVIVYTLLAESLVLLVSFRREFFKHPFYIMDLVIVIISVILENIHVSDAFQLVIVAMLWRIVRITHALFETHELEQHLGHNRKPSVESKEEELQLHH